MNEVVSTEGICDITDHESPNKAQIIKQAIIELSPVVECVYVDISHI